ncbi:hypothetical protein BDZ97DRAFT_1782094 [Flammula alnicola]|nr:hypothetical protein BDZ97DRAFT_1782094 [Flammula alnicola]
MRTSVVKLQEDSILDIAKDVIKPAGWNCEWNVASLQKPVQCRIVLNSWNAYLQHLLHHCQLSKAENAFVCRLPRCNIPSGLSIASYKDLANHIQQSHLNRVQLYCPVQGCNSLSFSRPALLESHFAESHLDLVNKEVVLPSDLLLPTWQPFYPLSKEVPPIPTRVAPGSGILPLVNGRARGRPAKTPEKADDLNTTHSPLTSPRKRPRLKFADTKPEEVAVRETAIFIFDDLPKQLDERGNYLPDNAELECVIRGKGPLLDVARPQDLFDPQTSGHQTPEGSILYDNFVRIHQLEDPKEPPSPRTHSQAVSTSRQAPKAANQEA